MPAWSRPWPAPKPRRRLPCFSTKTFPLWKLKPHLHATIGGARGFPETPDVADGSTTHALNELLPVFVLQGREQGVWEEHGMLSLDDGMRWAFQCRWNLCQRCLDRARSQLGKKVRMHGVRVFPRCAKTGQCQDLGRSCNILFRNGRDLFVKRRRKGPPRPLAHRQSRKVVRVWFLLVLRLAPTHLLLEPQTLGGSTK